MSTYAAVRDYVINPAYLNETVGPGAGVDMRDPVSPKAVSGLPFTQKATSEITEQQSRFGLETSNVAIADSFTFRTARTTAEEEHIIAENFKATYGLSSVSQAGTFAERELEEYNTTYALLEHVGETRTLPRGPGRQWAGPPLDGEGLAGDELRERFYDVYGTHFVSQAKYGLRVAIQAKVRKSAKQSLQELEVAFKAAFSGVGAEGGVAATQKQTLDSMHVDVTCETSSGGVEHGLPSLITTLDQVDDYLAQLRTGQLRYAVAPITLSLMSYLPTLDPCWDVYKALKQTVPPPAEVEYGVPLGTVVPWCPPASHVEGLHPAGPTVPVLTDVVVTPPLGWAVCDGTAGTPDLRERFVLGIGVTDWKGSPTPGGSREPLHLTTGGGPVGPDLPRGGGTRFHPSNYGHTHTLDLPAPELPPFVGLLYIMRVA